MIGKPMDQKVVSDSHPQVDVIIVNWNTSALLHNCLSSLYRFGQCTTNITVVDNASEDDSVTMIRRDFPEVTVIQNAVNEGFARANNRGYESSSSPYVLLLNSDTEVMGETIQACAAYLEEHDEVGAVGCRIENQDGSPQNSVFRFPSLRAVVSTTSWLAQAFPKSALLNHDRYAQHTYTEPTSVDVVMGSFLMVRRSDHQDTLFDDGFFMYAEEADLCRRIHERGLDVVFLPSHSVMHVKGASSRTPEQRAWSDEAKKRAQLRYLRKWHGFPTAYVANLVMLLGLLPRVPGWLTADWYDATQARPGGRALKAKALKFHLLCLVDPRLMSRRFWGPPTRSNV